MNNIYYIKGVILMKF